VDYLCDSHRRHISSQYPREDQEKSDRSQAITIHPCDHFEKGNNILRDDDIYEDIELLGGSDHDDMYSSETLYDLATWRMYYRIVEYRQQHPLTVTVTETSTFDNEIRSKASDSYAKNIHHHPSNHLKVQPLQQQSLLSHLCPSLGYSGTTTLSSNNKSNMNNISHEYEGEVFDLEI
jgi:hypothetical protein